MKEDKVIKKEVIVKEGGQMNQSITTVVEQRISWDCIWRTKPNKTCRFKFRLMMQLEY